MYLKRLEIQGLSPSPSDCFRIYAAIWRRHSVTAIVGPNGAGKSNILDAIRW